MLPAVQRHRQPPNAASPTQRSPAVGLTPWKLRFVEKFGFVVQGSPFADVKFHQNSVADAYLPLLTGGYEAETHGFIETALKRARADRRCRLRRRLRCRRSGVAGSRGTAVYAFDIRARRARQLPLARDYQSGRAARRHRQRMHAGQSR